MADRVIGFFAQQAFPPVQSRNIVALPNLEKLAPGDETKAYDLYAKYYTVLKNAKTSVSSKTVIILTDGVNHAELALVLWRNESEKNKKIREEKADEAADLQLRIFRAANWLRRFAYDRNKIQSWFDEEETKEAKELGSSMKADAIKLFNYLKESNNTIEQTIKSNEDMWVKNDEILKEQESKVREHNYAELEKALNNIKVQIGNLKFYVRELSDSRGGELEDFHKTTIAKAMKLMEAVEISMDIPPWRNQGILSLGPFGIKPVLLTNNKPMKFVDTNFKQLFAKDGKIPKFKDLQVKLLNSKEKVIGEYILKQEYSNRYIAMQNSDGTIRGKLSPFAPITIPKTDQTFTLIRIPTTAKYFAWAYPIVTSKAGIEENFKDISPTEMDLFLLLGGYVYFDEKMELIQLNALLPQGSQLQFSSPNQLPMKVFEILEKENRFHPITLDGLKATHFAWILPNEFTDSAIYGDKQKFPPLHPGAFAYKYENQETNNYFVLAAVDSVLGTKKMETSVS